MADSRGGRSSSSGVACPYCGDAAVDADVCRGCGLVQRGPEVVRLREIEGLLHELGQQQMSLFAERQQLLGLVRWEQPRRLSAHAGVREWKPEHIRNVLLWLGAALLALAAVTFTLFAFAHLDDRGRAGLLYGFTGLACLLTAGLRRRLPATAEAVGGLTLTLWLVDWFALRHAGIAVGIPVAPWWALGFAIGGLLAVFGALRLRLRVGRLGAALFGQLAAGAAVVTFGQVVDAPWMWAIAVAAAATVSTAVLFACAARHEWNAARWILGTGAVVFELAAGTAATFIALDVRSAGDVPGPALAVLVLGLAPALVAAWPTQIARESRLRALAVWLAATSFLAALLVCVIPLGTDAVLLAAAAFGPGVVLAARLAPVRTRGGVAMAGLAFVTGAVASQAGTIAAGVVAPLAWARAPWSGDLAVSASRQLGPSADLAAMPGQSVAVAVIVLASASAVAASTLIDRPRLMPPLTATFFTFGAVGAAVSVGPLVADWSVRDALIADAVAAVGFLAFAIVVERQGHAFALPAVAVAAAMLVPATGWAMAERSATGAWLAAVVIAAGLSSFTFRARGLRASAATIAATAALTRIGISLIGARPGVSGFAVACAGAVLVLAGALGRRHTPEGAAYETAGVLGLVAGASLGGVSLPWLAGSLTLAVPTCALVGLRRDRSAYGWFALALAVGSVWAWLAAAHIELPEAYTLPAAGAAFAAGLIRRRRSVLSSWVAYGPALVVGLVPTLVLVVERGGLVRPLALTMAALVCVVVGARRHLQAPLIVGAAALLALATNQLAPVAARAPRWAALAVAGVLLLWLGSTAERRLAGLRRLRSRLDLLR